MNQNVYVPGSVSQNDLELNRDREPDLNKKLTN